VAHSPLGLPRGGLGRRRPQGAPDRLRARGYCLSECREVNRRPLSVPASPSETTLRSGGLEAGSPRRPPDPCLVLCVDLVGSRSIWPAHVGRVVDPDGPRRIRSDRLDDQTDDQVAIRLGPRPSDRDRELAASRIERRDRDRAEGRVTSASTLSLLWSVVHDDPGPPPIEASRPRARRIGSPARLRGSSYPGSGSSLRLLSTAGCSTCIHAHRTLIACSGGYSRGHSTRPYCSQPDRTQRNAFPT
jgi:hypothetical protein